MAGRDHLVDKNNNNNKTSPVGRRAEFRLRARLPTASACYSYADSGRTADSDSSHPVLISNQACTQSNSTLVDHKCSQLPIDFFPVLEALSTQPGDRLCCRRRRTSRIHGALTPRTPPDAPSLAGLGCSHWIRYPVQYRFLQDRVAQKNVAAAYATGSAIQAEVLASAIPSERRGRPLSARCYGAHVRRSIFVPSPTTRPAWRSS